MSLRLGWTRPGRSALKTTILVLPRTCACRWGEFNTRRPDEEEGLTVIVRFLPLLSAGFLATFATGLRTVSAAERLRFWNLTTVTISELYLAPAGTTDWSANQCLNDRDGVVDSDERLAVTGIAPGIYDVKLVDKKGRICRLADVKVEAGRPYAFAISDRDLTNCTREAVQ
jgi:hypothetical protein